MSALAERPTVAHQREASGPRRTLVAAVYPLAAGVAQFNGAMARAMARTGPVDVISWKRLYPPLLYRGQLMDNSAQPVAGPNASFILDWHDPLSWRRAVRRIAAFEPEAVVLPWLHPVMAMPYRYLLRHMPRSITRVLVCHNVEPHEAMPGARLLSRSALRNADLVVTHAPHQAGELAALGLGSIPNLQAFHPRFAPEDFAPVPTAEETAEQRALHGDPDLLLLTFGAIRPYKGVDIALEALARVAKGLDVRLVVAGRSWGSADGLADLARRLKIDDRVEFIDRFIPNEEVARLFTAADAALLPYRSASQSGVVQLSFAYERPVVATRVGGLPAAVADSVDGILCEPAADSVARAIETMAARRRVLTAGVRAAGEETSFGRYCDLLDTMVSELRA